MSNETDFEFAADTDGDTSFDFATKPTPAKAAGPKTKYVWGHVVELRAGASKNTGTFEMTYIIQPEATEADPAPKKVWLRSYLTDKSRNIFENTLAATGFVGNVDMAVELAAEDDTAAVQAAMPLRVSVKLEDEGRGYQPRGMTSEAQLEALKAKAKIERVAKAKAALAKLTVK